MNSSLYECQMLHARFLPRSHRFSYRMFFLAVDLDELPNLGRTLRFFSHNRRNLFSFRDRDYLPTTEKIHSPPSELGDLPAEVAGSADSLKSRVERFLARHGIALNGGRVVLVTLPRMLGYLFNPVSFYFCYDRRGGPIASIAEVTNTFRETKLYLLGRDTLKTVHESAPAGTRADRAAVPPAVFRLRTPKYFYVSPFSDVDVEFDFALTNPTDRLNFRIDDYVDGLRTFTSSVIGQKRSLTSARLAWYLFKYPLLTVRVIVLIHWHALLLWIKRVPWFAKAARHSDQRELYRPHRSISSTHTTAIPPATGAVTSARA